MSENSGGGRHVKLDKNKRAALVHLCN